VIIDKYTMNNLDQLKKMSGIEPETITESKYGPRFDRLTGPFKNRGDKVLDKNDKFVAECDSTELAKEMAAILSDIKKMREICERFMSLNR
jgi:hypothetical protein